ncbi:MAG: ATP-binding cassette domain-containing protein [Deltaproteobacteria bacterium]|nr:ATP-binding cassette domain-containing protein [Deltaproteobacteria bacterium]
MIEVSGVSKSYAGIRAVDDVSFSVSQGEIVGFLGPNGAGKTTTMKMITGAIPADRGAIKVSGFDVFEQPMEVKRRTGYLPENPPVYNDMTVVSYLSFVAAIKGMSGARLRDGVDSSMSRCNVAGVAERLIGNLSKGFKQRVGIAQAILGNPEVLILDEPTIGLDPNQIQEVRSLIKELARERTVILSTHILPEVEMTCQRVMVIHRGRIVATDTMENIVKSRTGGESVLVRVRRDAEAAIKKAREALPVTIERHDGAADSFVAAFGKGEDRREDLARLMVEGGFGLIEMRSLSLSLEEVFRQLTTDEKAQ